MPPPRPQCSIPNVYVDLLIPITVFSGTGTHNILNTYFKEEKHLFCVTLKEF
jgi:hypothetical protein